MNKLFNPSDERTSRSDFSIALGLATVILFFIGSGYVLYANTRALNQNSMRVTQTHEIIKTLKEFESLIKDAETSQRGFVITGNDSYLVPYQNARTSLYDKLQVIALLSSNDNPGRKAVLGTLKQRVDSKMSELEETIQLRRDRGFEASKALVITDRGKNDMDSIRSQIARIESEEQNIRAERLDEMKKSYRTAVASGILASLLGIFLSCVVGYLLRRALNVRRHQEWIQGGESGLAKSMLGNQKLEQLADSTLKFLTEYFDAQAAAFYASEGDYFRRVATYGVPADAKMPDSFNPGQGLLGQAVKDARTFIVRDVPDGYLTVGSALGQRSPLSLLIAPVTSESTVNGVIELGFFRPLDERVVQLFDQVRESIGMAIRAAHYRAHLQNLLEETQRQSEELQAQSEELRVSNEELEEQSRALKESQSRLEQQQAEMEQTNSQLEEQTQLLETQKDELERSKESVQAKAKELEQASQYKSDFLANMSHELRTPLNSSLILAKLLADNASGNLTEEQVKFAQTIQNSGNDLLTLINDILDLSKIEAGHMEVRPERVTLDRLMRDLLSTFEPMAQQKGLKLKIDIDTSAPKSIETDRQRLEQILKNLISNAIKFTEKGGVTVNIGRHDKSNMVFAVTDTGIGITPDKQQFIFEAFRQEDSTISRKYGGTGLGLSISRELSRLLGGRIELESTPAKGSTFRVILPETYDPSAQPQTQAYRIAEAPKTSLFEKTPIPENKTEKIRAVGRIKDDRDDLDNKARLILIIEDDEPFAKILYELAHQNNFKCIVAATAEEGLTLARQYTPNAVILDVGLPDNSGLSVLDRLKRNAQTRHIPVHVISANDYTQTALSLGAAGYMIKPVKREQLVEALKNLETKFAQRLRRVLIVEDDKTQRESIGKLIGSQDVQTVEVGTAAECLERLKEGTYDCMVLDLTLPDASGYSLLETLSKEESYSFPPVIVYTGRDLSTDEEQRLRRYSRSIIIKGAKSPERLLDEVTLFLHQVVSELPVSQQKMLEQARHRDADLENRRILIVEDDVANIYALTSVLEPRGAIMEIARNGREALDLLEKSQKRPETAVDLILMDMMMPEMDGLTATISIRKKPEWKKLPIIMLTAKAMRDDQERCISAGANDYMAKPLDVEKLLSLVRVWMPR